MTENRLYNPLDYENLTASVVREMMARDPVPLPLEKRFPGPGVYALFYCGSLGCYAPISSSEWERPIYVGKAVTPGSRKGGRTRNLKSPALYSRISTHVKSIQAAENLSISDFRCRYLTVMPLWITMAERFLIEHYQPIWNVSIEGFGLHDPGSGRYEGEIPWWDTLHPGRPWAARLRKTKTVDDALERVRRALLRED